MGNMSGFGFVMPHWLYWGWLAVMPLLLLWINGFRKPNADDEVRLHPHPGNRLTRWIDWTSEWSGIFVALWTVNAVVFYFFEVVMRYIFNMPTIWVHEASYLLLGMQYLMTGAYAFLHGAHVRVDVVYNFLPPRGRVGMDIFSSMFFFIFALALTVTSWTYFSQSLDMGETTIETWGVQYYPVKGLMTLGSVLILLAGVSKLIKDVLLYIEMGRRDVA
ncbi:TRAP transporter small permease subunit [Litorivicinus lipolyticus]|uniref:TRAP transporter small permease protein n=1 Tax=Litorivicinus lipolyticus TaxID=418701 RepID=A0A5Q2QCP0_9GAMM|nr:TRAP transporter small permease subunit [Litorivicinus lipolyticus]QGG79600.1 TRAP transporter small permease subunit [Litorivicinus lipolyticus]